MTPSSAFLTIPCPRSADASEIAQALAEALCATGLDDLRQAEHVHRALRATGYPAMRAIEVTAHDRVITLRGRVLSYYMKQMAQEVARAVAEVQELRNELQVGTPVRQ